jgi:hypothetical protein
MEPFTLALLGGSALFSVLGKMGRGKAEAQEAADKAQAARVESQMYHLRATQTAELSRQQLDQTLGTIDSIRSARGLNLDSQTGQALERQTEQNAYRNEAVSVLGALNQASGSNMAAAGYTRTAKNAIPLAMLDSAATIAGKAFTAQSVGAFG